MGFNCFLIRNNRNNDYTIYSGQRGRKTRYVGGDSTTEKFSVHFNLYHKSVESYFGDSFLYSKRNLRRWQIGIIRTTWINQSTV